MRPALALALALTVLAIVGVAAGCGGGEEASPTPETVEGTVGEDGETETEGAETETAETETEGGETETDEGETEAEGDPEAGKEVFASAGCGSCHVLADSNTNGTIGPNLDEAKPSRDLAVDRVTNGMGVMPAFKGQLDEQQIADVAAYVVQATSG